MKILIINWRDIGHPRSGGAEIVTMEHAKGWVSQGHSVTWLTSSYNGAPREEIRDGVTLIHRGGSLTVYLVAPFYVGFYSHLYDIIVDEVHGIPFFSLLFTKKPVIVFIHEIAGEIWDYMYTFPINRIGKFLENLYLWLYRRSRFWTDAPSTVDDLVAKGIPRENCFAIPCPISDKKRKLTSKDKRPTYMFLSRVVRMKGIEEVIKAFAFIHTVQKDAVLWIVGGGEADYLRSLHKTVHEYKMENFVRFYGKVSEDKKLQLLSRAHILLHASVKEGWGLVVLEAAAQGTPTVAYDVHGLRDVVRNGSTGVVIKRNVPNELAREAVRLYNDPKRYNAFQREGMVWVNSLTWEKAVDQSLKLLYLAVGDPRKGIISND